METCVTIQISTRSSLKDNGQLVRPNNLLHEIVIAQGITCTLHMSRRGEEKSENLIFADADAIKLVESPYLGSNFMSCQTGCRGNQVLGTLFSCRTVANIRSQIFRMKVVPYTKSIGSKFSKLWFQKKHIRLETVILSCHGETTKRPPPYTGNVPNDH